MNKGLVYEGRNKVRVKWGFTLIELLVVISITSFLSSVILSSFNDASAKARDSARTMEIGQYKKAIMLSYNEYGVYPRPAYNITGSYCLGEYPQTKECGINYCCTENTIINNAVKKYLSELPPIKETTIVLLSPFSVLSTRGIQYNCNDVQCSSATIKWGLEKDKTCPEGKVSAGYERVCEFTFR